ncbi:hypothetical protein KP509_27G070500 [Ceratopteris richardii]|uniref:Rab3-GAP regulatory subunit N-terminal domain-containing protein n=1 Tax=Ceratopteris richardii TaxID=49495 RepID=A0A8T2RJM8_CERRI|nr:hypothetical protein KP509_27G070500 [Ceratopteris richardii]
MHKAPRGICELRSMCTQRPSTEYRCSVGPAFEGWMKDSSSSSPLLLAMSSELLAIARPRAVLILKCKALGDTSRSPVFTFALPRSEDGHHIKAVQWLTFPDWHVLVLGTTQGSVLFFSTRGSLLLRQVFYVSPVLRLQVRAANGIGSTDGSEELFVIYGSVIVFIDMKDLQPLLHRNISDADVVPRGRFSVASVVYPNMAQKVAFQIWNINKNLPASSCVDGIVSGIIRSPLFESTQLKEKQFCAITLNQTDVFTAHRLIENQSSSITSFIVKKLAPVAWSTFSFLTRMFWQDSSDGQPVEVKPQEFSRASLMATLNDAPRKGKSVSLSPSGTLAAVNDSLGRVLLIDTHVLHVVRLWKGYRDAQCFFLDVPVESSSSQSISSRSTPKDMKKQDFKLALAIYAPLRGVVEVWQLRNGRRLSIIKCGCDYSMIQPAIPLCGSGARSSISYTPTELCILHCYSGKIVTVKPQLLSIT